MTTDTLRVQGKMGMFMVVAMYWIIVALIPAVILGYIRSPLQDVWQVALMCAAIVGYCAYTGYRAWKRGWRSRFILRVVVPGALFVISFACFGLLPWWLPAQ